MSKRMKYTEAHLAFLKEGYKRMKTGDLVEAFNQKFGTTCSFMQIRKTLDRYGFRAGRKGGFTAGMSMVPITDSEREFLKHHAHLPNAEIVRLHNSAFNTKRTFDSLTSLLRRMRLSKQKQRALEDGDVVSHHKQGYQLIKVPRYKCGRTYRNYKYKHVAVWEEVNGPVPDGYCVRFLDSDNTNCTLENLVLVSMEEHGRLYNKLRHVEPELRNNVLAVVRLEAKCAELEKVNN